MQLHRSRCYGPKSHQIWYWLLESIVKKFAGKKVDKARWADWDFVFVLVLLYFSSLVFFREAKQVRSTMKGFCSDKLYRRKYRLSFLFVTKYSSSYDASTLLIQEQFWVIKDLKISVHDTTYMNFLIHVTEQENDRKIYLRKITCSMVVSSILICDLKRKNLKLFKFYDKLNFSRFECHISLY